MITVAPSRPRPTVNMPATPPVRNATLRASGSELRLAAAAVRTLPRRGQRHADVAREARQEATGDERQGAEQARLDEARAPRAPSGFDDLRRGDEHDRRERDRGSRRSCGTGASGRPARLPGSPWRSRSSWACPGPAARTPLIRMKPTARAMQGGQPDEGEDGPLTALAVRTPGSRLRRPGCWSCLLPLWCGGDVAPTG